MIEESDHTLMKISQFELVSIFTWLQWMIYLKLRCFLRLQNCFSNLLKNTAKSEHGLWNDRLLYANLDRSATLTWPRGQIWPTWLARQLFYISCNQHRKRYLGKNAEIFSKSPKFRPLMCTLSMKKSVSSIRWLCKMPCFAFCQMVEWYTRSESLCKFRVWWNFPDIRLISKFVR